MIQVLDHGFKWRGIRIMLNLSDCWTSKGKPVRFQFKRIHPERNASIYAYNIIIGPVQLLVGWLAPIRKDFKQ